MIAEVQKPSSLLTASICYKPFVAPWAVEIAKKHEQSHWIEDEVDLGDDVRQWNDGTITEIEKQHLVNILRLFTQSDVAVGQNYYEQLIPAFKNNEIRNMLGSFAAREGIHQRAYALLVETLGFPESEFSSFLDYKEASDKINFMMESNTSSKKGIALTLAKSVFNEGLSLFASFVMLLNYQRFGKMLGTAKIAAWSLADETLHVEGNARLFREFLDENPRLVNDEFKTTIYDMGRQIVKLEDKFLDLAYKMGEPAGLTQKEVSKYIRYMCDRRLIQLGLKGNYKVKENPLPWLGWLSGEKHESFFETRVSSYDISGLKGNWW